MPAKDTGVALRRPSTWLALALLAGCLGMVGFSLASLVLPGGETLPDRPNIWDFVFVMAVLLAFPVVGAVVAALRPRNRIGWLFLAIGLSFVVGIFGAEYAARALYTDAPLPGASFAAWVSAWAWILAIGLAVTVTLLIFPDGRLPSPRWRPVFRAACLSIAIGSITSALSPSGLEQTVEGRLANPFAVRGTAGVFVEIAAEITLPVLLFLGLLSLVALLTRFRRSRGIERQQLKWFLSGGAMLLIGFVIAFVTMHPVAWYLALLGLASLPIAAGIAILRYRLYDIDRIISRTVGWAVVTGILVTVFGAVVLGFQAILAGVTQGETLAVAASTLVAAALFQPVRSRVQRTVDRRFHRAGYDAEGTVARFADRLRDEVELGAIRREAMRVVAETMAPQHSTLWLCPSRRPAVDPVRNDFRTPEA